MVIWYLLIVSAGFLTTNTVAYYSDHKQGNGSMTIGTWESEDSEHQKERNEKAKVNGEEQEMQPESAAQHTTDE